MYYLKYRFVIALKHTEICRIGGREMSWFEKLDYYVSEIISENYIRKIT
jgi:hypothetical protein